MTAKMTPRISAEALGGADLLDCDFESLYDNGAQSGPATRKRPGPWPTPTEEGSA